MSPRKVRLVIDVVRGMPVEDAIRQLGFSPKAAAGPVIKLLRSAAANAEHNHKADPKTLRIAKITADGGPTLHRGQPRAHGRAAPIRKRTTHIQVILSDESPADVHKAQVKGGPRKQPKTTKDTKSSKAPAKTGKKSEGKPALKPKAEGKLAKASVGAERAVPKGGDKKSEEKKVEKGEKKPAKK
jgi:large subunit ribosomal protein L22